MARYIDAEKLSREVISSWDKDKHVTIEASRVHRQEHHHLMRIIEKQPTADVVPKSEVERMLDELWGEIRKIASDYPRGALLALLKLAELKKKYIDGD